VDIWVEAFAADPYFRWIAPSDADWSSFGPRWMAFIADLCFERGHTHLSDDMAVSWVPPDVAVAGPDDFARGRSLIAEQPVYGYEFTGHRHDAGTRIGWLEANVALALESDLADEFRGYLRGLDLRD